MDSESSQIQADTFEKQVDKFNKFIEECTFKNEDITTEQRKRLISENLRYGEFCLSVRAIFDRELREDNLKNMYRKITTNPNNQTDWTELFGYANDDPNEALPAVENVSVFTASKHTIFGDAGGNTAHRDIIQDIKLCPSIDAYVTVSQKGAVAVWSRSKLELLTCIDIKEPFWTTAVDYCAELRRIIICTERSIVIWDHRGTGKTQFLYSIKPLAQSPRSLVCISPLVSSGEGRLLFGDDQGFVNVLTIISRDINPINTPKPGTSCQTILIPPNKLKSHIIRRKVTNDWIVQTKFIPELDCFACCSNSAKDSFVLEPLEKISNKAAIKTLSVDKGVNAFDYSAKVNVLVTGGVDKIIRIWNPHIWSKPVGRLSGHIFTICTIVCNDTDQQIISLSTGRGIRVWDIPTLSCLQSFASDDQLAGEKRIYSLVFDTKHERLISGSSILTSWPMTRAVQDTMQVPHTHERPVAAIACGSGLDLVYTVCTDSTLKAWSRATGDLLFTNRETNGPGVEVSRLAIDSTSTHLITCGKDGSLRLWDTSSGQELCVNEQLVTGEEDVGIIDVMLYRTGGNEYLIVCAKPTTVRIFQIEEKQGSSHSLAVVAEYHELADSTAAFTCCQLAILPQQPSATLANHTVPAPDETNCTSTAATTAFAFLGCADGSVVRLGINSTALQPNAESAEAFVIAPTFEEATQTEAHTATLTSVVCMAAVQHQRTVKRLKTVEEEDDIDNVVDEDKYDSYTEDLPPILVCCYETQQIKILSMDGKLFTTFSPDMYNKDAKISSMDVNCKDRHIVLGDKKGNLLLVSISEFLKSVQSVESVSRETPAAVENDDASNNKRNQLQPIRQIVTWRAHSGPITAVKYVENAETLKGAIILSASTDGSVRIWHGSRFFGYFGQARHFNQVVLSRSSLPYDINAAPIWSEPDSQVKQKQKAKKRVEYPLTFMPNKWDPLTKTQFIRRKEKSILPLERKYFKAVVKPKAYNHHLEGTTTASRVAGGVFRSIPVYKVNPVPSDQ